MAAADTSTEAKKAMLPSTVLPSAGHHLIRPTRRPTMEAWHQLYVLHCRNVTHESVADTEGDDAIV
jgi:hypothetical protein